MRQLVDPDTGTVDFTGMCLRFAQSVFDAPVMYPSATAAANATTIRHHTREMPDVACLVWFDHYGTYGNPPTYGNWGHVAVWVPGSGFLSSPPYAKFDAAGKQVPWSQWYPTLEAIEAAFAAPYRFFTEDINGLRVCEPGEEDDMTEDERKKLYEIHWMLEQRVRPEQEKQTGILNGAGWGVRHLLGDITRLLIGIADKLGVTVPKDVRDRATKKTEE